MITVGATPLLNITSGTAHNAIKDVYCVGTELHLMDCPLNLVSWDICEYSDGVGVRCLAASPGPGVCLYLWECQALSCLITQQTIILYKIS